MNSKGHPVRAWHDCETPFIATHYQPATLIDHALARGIDSHRLLRGTGMFYEDLLTGTRLISPRQFLRLIANAQQLIGADDTSFLFGQQQLPGHCGAASHALSHADSLDQALERLIALRPLVSPLLHLRTRVDEQHLHLTWVDTYGAGEQLAFLVEASMTAMTAMCRWLSGETWPWQYQLGFAKPRHIEQYWVHMGEDLRFGCPLNTMRLPRSCLVQRWPQASAITAAVTLQQARAELEGLPLGQGSLLEVLFEHIQLHIRDPLNLERVAQAFAMSPATLKRHMKRHGTHFQAQLDQVRTHEALALYLSKGYSTEEVAAYLNFNDPANFRRSLRRWTGCSPGELKLMLG
ncbi:MAG: AraC family transcriptional regulator [Sphingopyxis sp.]|nr:MAG: AraC family transcriptional regulator [Sphingopyxis sp.]